MRISNPVCIFPNPLPSGSAMHISFNKMEEGYYQLSLHSYSGKLVQQKDIWIDEEARVLTLETFPMAAGNYLLNLVSKKTGEQQSAKLLVQ